MGDLGSCVGHFEGEIVANFPLDCQVPLLRVPGAQSLIHREDSLTQAGVRCERDGGDAWPARQGKGWVDIVKVSLSHRLKKRKLGNREGCGNASLLNPDQAVAGTDNGFFAEPVNNAKARPEIQLMQLAGTP